MMDDAELLRRYAENHSESAFTEFVGRHLALVYFTALRGTDGDTALAQEVAQAVFGVAARRVATLVGHPTPTGWLHTTARHLALRASRKERTRRRYEKEAAMQGMITGDPAHDWDRLRPVIDDALGELDAREREAILVRFFEGRPFADIGAAWRISQDAARMRVDRALEKLRVALERRGIRSVSAALGTVLASQAGLAAPPGLIATVSGAALSAGAAPGGMAAFFNLMSATKIIVTTAVLVAVLASGMAVLQHRRAETATLRAEAATQELAAARNQLARAEQRRTTAESAAAEAEKDNADLLAAVRAARNKSAAAVSAPTAAASGSSSAPNDLLAQTLQPLFPNGVVAQIGGHTITVDDVRRQIAPLLARLQQDTGNPADLPPRLYALQNSVIAGLITRDLNIREFHNQLAGDPPKSIPDDMLNNAVADRVKEQFNNDQAAFLASLTAQGQTPEQYRKGVEEDIIFSYMTSQQRRLQASKDAGAKPKTP